MRRLVSILLVTLILGMIWPGLAYATPPQPDKRYGTVRINDQKVATGEPGRRHLRQLHTECQNAMVEWRFRIRHEYSG